MAKPDPTKDPEFQKAVQALLNTKPHPHKKSAAKQPKKPLKKRPKYD